MPFNAAEAKSALQTTQDAVLLRNIVTQNYQLFGEAIETGDLFVVFSGELVKGQKPLVGVEERSEHCCGAWKSFVLKQIFIIILMYFYGRIPFPSIPFEFTVKRVL